MLGLPWAESSDPRGAGDFEEAFEPSGYGIASDKAVKSLDEKMMRKIEALQTTDQQQENVLLGLRDVIYGHGWDDPGLKTTVSVLRYDVDNLKKLLAGRLEPVMLKLQGQFGKMLDERFAKIENDLDELKRASGERGGGAAGSSDPALEARVAATEAGLAQLASSSVPALEGRVAATEAGLAQLASRSVPALEGRAAATEARLAELASAQSDSAASARQALRELGALDERVAALEADAARAGSEVLGLRGALGAQGSALGERIDELQERVGGIEEGDDALRGLRARLAVALGEQDTEESCIGQLQEKVEQLRGQVQALQARAGENARKCGSNQREAARLDEEVKKLKDEASPHEGRGRSCSGTRTPGFVEEPEDGEGAAAFGGGGGAEFTWALDGKPWTRTNSRRGSERAVTEERVGEIARAALETLGADGLQRRVGALEAKVEAEYEKQGGLLQLQYEEVVRLQRRLSEGDMLDAYLQRLARGAQNAVLSEVMQAWQFSCKRRPALSPASDGVAASGGTSGQRRVLSSQFTFMTP